MVEKIKQHSTEELKRRYEINRKDKTPIFYMLAFIYFMLNTVWYTFVNLNIIVVIVSLIMSIIMLLFAMDFGQSRHSNMNTIKIILETRELKEMIKKCQLK